MGKTDLCSPDSVLLPDGKVLLVQGSRAECNDDVYQGEFEVYDPQSGVIQSFAWPLWRDDVAATANFLKNGRVLTYKTDIPLCGSGGFD